MSSNRPQVLPPAKLIDSVKLFFTRCFDFRGRTRSSEFLGGVFFQVITGGIFFFGLPAFFWYWFLLTLPPILSLTVRRLHDTGRCGWHVLWNLFPIVGQLVLLFLCTKNSDGDNRWGPNPEE